ncbi:MAG: hypothetical protein ACFB11_05880 [Paracoccaceae bacterium]
MKDRGPFHSADTTGGWRNHYARIRRWGRRVLELAKREAIQEIDHQDLVDFALVYFIWAHSLLEWLVVDEASKADSSKAAAFGHPQWRLLCALANRSRHFDQTLKVDQLDKYWSIKRSYDPFLSQLTDQSGVGTQIVYNGQKYALSELVRRISKMWSDILDQSDLNPDELWRP